MHPQVPLELIEWQPVYHQAGATGVSGGEWGANWRVSEAPFGTSAARICIIPLSQTDSLQIACLIVACRFVHNLQQLLSLHL